jgi:protoporphyrinogen oxidase
MSVAVIGAGPAGMTAAYQLAKAGVDVEVFEAGSAVGGLARTISLWGQRVDLGPHRFFSSDRRVNELWLEVVGRDYDVVPRLTRIYYGGRFYAYPLRPANALWNLGAVEAATCLASYAGARLRPRAPARDDSFEDWVVARFGRRLFEIFFKAYSEKLWGIPCHALDADFAAQRIRTLSLSVALRDALGLSGRRRPRTLLDQFAYPHGGTGSVYERMAQAVRARGGRVHLGAPVRRVLAAAGVAHALELEDGSVRAYDHIVSSMPLSLLVSRLPEVPAEVRRAAESLRFRNTLLVYLHVRATDLFPDNWLYIHAPSLQVGRVTNFRNWTPHLFGDAASTILALEYWCDDGDPLWAAPDAALIALGVRELRGTGLLGTAAVDEGHVHRIRRCYPVYERGYRTRLRPVEAYLRTLRGLSAIGRYGAFKYNNQDHSILMGLLAAENIAAGTTHDLWAINSDYDSYQEATLITRTGLVVADR